MLGLLERYTTPTLDAALLCSSRAGSDRMSGWLMSLNHNITNVYDEYSGSIMMSYYLKITAMLPYKHPKRDSIHGQLKVPNLLNEKRTP